MIRIMIKAFWLPVLIFTLINPVSRALASDDLLVYSDRYNNGWGDWGWVPHYGTNSPVHSGTNAMVFAASSSWQALWLRHDAINTSIYTNLSIWVNGGPAGGQYFTINAEQNGTELSRVAFTAPTNAWR